MLVKNLNPTNPSNAKTDWIKYVLVKIFFNDPFKRELTSSQIYKGGDGGCQLHDSVGLFWGYLPLATYYHSSYSEIDLKDVSNKFIRRTIKI